MEPGAGRIRPEQRRNIVRNDVKLAVVSDIQQLRGPALAAPERVVSVEGEE
jgi:hypothetical protein